MKVKHDVTLLKTIGLFVSLTDSECCQIRGNNDQIKKNPQFEKEVNWRGL